MSILIRFLFFSLIIVTLIGCSCKTDGVVRPSERRTFDVPSTAVDWYIENAIKGERSTLDLVVIAFPDAFRVECLSSLGDNASQNPSSLVPLDSDNASQNPRIVPIARTKLRTGDVNVAKDPFFDSESPEKPEALAYGEASSLFAIRNMYRKHKILESRVWNKEAIVDVENDFGAIQTQTRYYLINVDGWKTFFQNRLNDGLESGAILQNKNYARIRPECKD